MSAHRLATTALIAVVTASVAFGSEPASDFPGASDFHVVTRPANSFIIGAMHIDNDEYAVPLGPVERGAEHPGKSLTVTGPIDTLAYAGPKTASSLTTYNGLASQLTAAGYTAVWSCVRATCGSAFTLANILDTPMIDAVHQGDWGNWLIDDLNATNDDIRYGTFRKGSEYMLVMGSLSPGHDSGALLIRVNGPANDPVLRVTNQAEQPAAEGSATAAADTTAAPAAATTNPATTNPQTSTQQKILGKARSILSGVQ